MQRKQAPFAVMVLSFSNMNMNGKHTVGPESMFKGLPRLWVITNQPKGCQELQSADSETKEAGKSVQVNELERSLMGYLERLKDVTMISFFYRFTKLLNLSSFRVYRS